MTDASLIRGDAVSLVEVARLLATQKLPPVERWNPPHHGHSAMRIARDGRWYHEGAPIDRPAMVRLFASILRREPDGSHVLVTPAEKLDIDVDDAPFVAVAMTSEGEGSQRTLVFQLNTGDYVIAGKDNPLRMVASEGDSVPYLHVRAGLEARVARPVYYQLAELAIAEDGDPPGLWSQGVRFALGDAA
jgi:hypothetical protein